MSIEKYWNMIRMQVLIFVCTLCAMHLRAQPKDAGNFESDDCILFYDHAKVKDYQKFSELPKLIQQKLDSLINKKYAAFSSEMEFKVGRLYNPKLFMDSLDEDLRKMYVVVLYGLKLKGERDSIYELIDREIEQDVYRKYIKVGRKHIGEYCVYFSFDTAGNRTRRVYMPSEKWLGKPLISAQEAKDIVQKRTEGNFALIHLEMYFNMKEQCFIWLVECIHGQGIYEANEVNAHTGEVMATYKKERRRGGF